MKLFTWERTLNGVVTVRLEGGLTGRLLNLALESGVEVWNVRSEDGAVLFEILARDYARLRAFRRRSQCRMHIVKRSGLPFSIRRMRHPAGVVLGLALMIGLIYLMGSLVMEIRIVGNTALSGSVLMQSLETHGLRAGMRQSEIDTDTVVHRVLIDNDALSWMAINPMFGTVEVIVWDKIERPQPGVGAFDAAVRAGADAQIVEVEAESGEALVRPGDIVRQGDWLVVPPPQSMHGSWTGSVRAQVWAKTSRTVEFTVARSAADRTPTGRVQKEYALELFGEVYPVFSPGSTFLQSDSASYRRPLRLFSVTLPVSLIVTEHTETEQRGQTLTDAQLEARAQQAREAYERQNFADVQILNRTAQLTIDGEGAVLRVEYLCLEDIAEYAPYGAATEQSPPQ